MPHTERESSHAFSVLPAPSLRQVTRIRQVVVRNGPGPTGAVIANSLRQRLTVRDDMYAHGGRGGGATSDDGLVGALAKTLLSLTFSL